MMGLTSLQRRALEAIRLRIAECGSPPSVRELASGLGMKSHTGAARVIRILEDRGHVVTLHGRARSVTLVEPMPRCPSCASASP